MRILVCDDETDRCQQSVEEIEAAGVGHELIAVEQEELVEVIERLVERGTRFLLDRANTVSRSTNLIDRHPADMVIIDNNLSELRMRGVRHTAESLAGLIRAFTDTLYIVSLNKNPQTDFDLRFLVGDYQTVTDLALKTEHLASRALWTGMPSDSKDGFLPWYWPALNDEPERRREQQAFVDRHLGESILDSLSISESASGFLSRHAQGALARDLDKDVQSVTFLDFFVSSCRSLPAPKDRQKVVDLLRGGCEEMAAAARLVLVRVVAAELDMWFRRDLVSPQTALVDLPHLLTRMPFLLGSGASDLQAWNEAVHCRDPYKLVADGCRDQLEAAEFRHHCWTTRRCFWWPSLKESEELNARFFDEADPPWAHAAFCEDLSQFRLEASNLREFTAEFEGNWCRRYLAWLEGYSYTPQSRMAQ